MTEINESLQCLGAIEQEEHILRFFHVSEKLREDFNHFCLVFLSLWILEKRAEQVKHVWEDWSVNYISGLFLVIHNWCMASLVLLLIQHGQLAGQARLICTPLILCIWRILVILIDDFHDKRNKCLDKDLPTLCEIAPLFEQIHQLLT